MPTNTGNLKEMEIVNHLNNKKIKDLSNNLRSLVQALYGPLEENKKVKCELVEGFIKPDFVITYNGEKKYVSMKTGRAEVVHQENIKSFILFLRSLGVSAETQKTILFYQYGDGTLDGSGEQRFNYNRLRVLLEDRIDRANHELNNDIEIIRKVIDRCIITGTLENAIPIDGLYFGDVNYGEIMTVKQLKRHIDKKDWLWMKNLHIGPIQIRPHARYIGKEIKNPEAREKVECYWANLSADVSFISGRYDY